MSVTSAWAARRTMSSRSTRGLDGRRSSHETSTSRIFGTYPPANYAGIVVLDLPNHANAGQVVRALETFARTSGWLELLSGRLAIVEPSRVRFRPAP